MSVFKTMILLRKRGMYEDGVRPPDVQRILAQGALSVQNIKNMKNIFNKYLDDMTEIRRSFSTPPEVEHPYASIVARINSISMGDTKETIEHLTADLGDLAVDLKEHLDLVAFKNNVSEQLIRQLSQPPADETKTDIRTLLDTYTSDELNDLSSGLSLQQALKLDTLSKSVKMKLNAYLDQRKLNEQLKTFGFVEAGTLPVAHSACRRVILTTRDVLDGLTTISTYLHTTGKAFADIENGSITASDLIPSSEDAAISSSSSSSGPEIAWGLLSSLKKHEDDHPFVTTSFEVAGKAVPLLGESATLVLDGHGSKVSATFGDQKELATAALAEHVTPLIKVDTDHHIDHVILQSCMSGSLKPEDDLYVKQNTASGKGRKIIHRGEKDTDDLFNKMGEGKKAMSTLAEITYHAIVEHAERKDIAFTFSEYLINPSNELTGGNVGVKPQAFGETRTSWPKSMVLTGDEGVASSAGTWKSYTIVPGHEHRKSAESDSRHIKYRYQTQKAEFDALSGEVVSGTAATGADDVEKNDTPGETRP